MTPETFPPTASAYWGSKAAEYDDFIRRVVPRYDEMTERLLECLPQAPERVLELGCGTGNLSVLLLERFRHATFTFVDAAPEMVAMTRARLDERSAEAAGRCRFRVARFEELTAEPDAFDLVVSSLSLHHVTDCRPVYESLRGSLRAGGALRVADGYGGAAPALHTLHLTRWEAFWRAPGHLTGDEIAQVREHVARHDHYTPIAEHFRLLMEAGFADRDCVWRDGLFAIIAADVA